MNSVNIYIVQRESSDRTENLLKASFLNIQYYARTDALWSYLTWQYEIDFVCNPEKRDQIITDVEKRKEKLCENAGIYRIED